MEMNKHSIDNFVNEVTGSTSDGISEECNIHSAKFGSSAKSWGRTLVLEGLFCSLIAFRNVLDVSVFLLRKFRCLCPHVLTVCITD